MMDLDGYIEYHEYMEARLRDRLNEIKKNGSRKQFLPCLDNIEMHRQYKEWLSELKEYKEKYK